MVSLKTVQESNASLQSISPGQVALFVGATSGIAMHTLLEYARNSNKPKIYIVGRGQAKLSPLIENLKKINQQGSYVPLQYSISLLKNVDAACDELKTKEDKLDLLVMCPGYLKLSWIENEDGLEDTISLRYYVRMRFIHNLLPLLLASPTSRILSIHGAGREGHLIESDLELRHNFSMRNAAMHTSTMNTLALQEVAATHPTISCVHVFPGVVVTKGYDLLAEDFWAPLRWMFVNLMLPVMRMVTTSLEESGQRHLFHATSARYPPREGEWKGLPLPERIQVAEGADGKVGSGCYLLGPDGETVGDKELLEEYRRREMEKKIWEHTLEVFERVDGNRSGILDFAQARPTANTLLESQQLSSGASQHLRPVLEKRQQFAQGQPINAQGKGAPIAGGTNRQLDLQNPDNLGAQSTDSGVVPNLKWSLSDSKTRLFPGGWVREQVITDLPASHDIAGAQVHLTKGALRELHWHRVAEWGYVYQGTVRVSAVDEHGENQVDDLQVGDIWYFPKGQAHTLQGLGDQNEFLLAFDDGNFDAAGTTFMVDDWLAHTPTYILAKNFGVDESVFKNVPTPDPYILKGTDPSSTEPDIPNPNGKLEGNSSYTYHLSQQMIAPAPGRGGTIAIVDSRNFPIATTIAAAVVTLEPGGLRELHWHPNAEEWLYFHRGQARATVFLGGATARTFDFTAGDTAVFPDNSGHYVENTSHNETLIWIELYKSDRVADVSLTQWLALTPQDIVASTLKIPLEVVKGLKKEKQLLLAKNRTA
ncbi:MAG: hypothetical protein Q9225_000132 [Loekoesia sp. 1 TL-2023]